VRYIGISEEERYPDYNWEEVERGGDQWRGFPEPFGGITIDGSLYMRAFCLTDDELADLEDVTERYNDWQSRLSSMEPMNE